MNWRMFWPFKRRIPESASEPVKRTEYVGIPDDKIEELARLWDAMERAIRADAGAYAARYAVWKHLEGLADTVLAPMPKGTRWTQSVDWSCIMHPRLKIELTMPAQPGPVVDAAGEPEATT